MRLDERLESEVKNKEKGNNEESRSPSAEISTAEATLKHSPHVSFDSSRLMRQKMNPRVTGR
jgi:hypothetical protein